MKKTIALLFLSVVLPLSAQAGEVVIKETDTAIIVEYTGDADNSTAGAASASSRRSGDTAQTGAQATPEAIQPQTPVAVASASQTPSGADAEDPGVLSERTKKRVEQVESRRAQREARRSSRKSKSVQQPTQQDPQQFIPYGQEEE